MKGIKIVLTLCVFALTLSSSYAQKTLEGVRTNTETKSVTDTRPGSETKDEVDPCDDAYAIFHLLVFDQEITSIPQLKAAIRAAKTRMSIVHRRCIGSGACSGVQKAYISAARAGKGMWSNSEELERLISKAIVRAHSEFPDCNISTDVADVLD